LLSVVGLRWRRRGPGGAIALAGLAGIALLAPALRLPNGVPSPAASLGHIAPWQHAVDAGPANDSLRDVTFQIQPWLLFTRSELRAGRLPTWNPYQGAGTAFWSNGQGAPLFPLHLLFAALPLQLGLLLLPWLKIIIGATGTWCLGRALGLGPPAATLASVVFALSGMPVAFLLYPMASAIALVPWVFWSVERLASGGSWRPLAVFGGLQLLAGHPETALHTAMLTGLYLVVRSGLGPGRPYRAFVLGWFGAAGIAAVQILPFALALPATSRWNDSMTTGFPDLAVVLPQALRLLLPDLLGRAADGSWFGPFTFLALSLYAGALTLPLAAAAAPRIRADRRWAAVTVVLVFSFAGAFHLPGVRELLAAPPILGRALHHRLLFGVALGFALLAGAGLERWRETGARRLVAGAGALVLSGLSVAWWLHYATWVEHDLVGRQLAWTAWALTAIVLLLVGGSGTAWRRHGVTFVVVTATVDLLAAHSGHNPGLPLDELYPETPAIEALKELPGRIAAVGSHLRPNATMVYGLFDVRVDDPMKSVEYERINATFGAGHPTAFRPIRDWSSPWLDELGVRWVLGAPHVAAPAAGWRIAYDGDDARIFERPRAKPLVRFSVPAAGTVRVLERRAGAWRLETDLTRPAPLVVAEMASPGWRARVDGGAVRLVDSPLLTVTIPPGTHRVALDYRPPGLGLGAALSAAALALIGASGLYSRRRRSLSAITSRSISGA